MQATRGQRGFPYADTEVDLGRALLCVASAFRSADCRFHCTHNNLAGVVNALNLQACPVQRVVALVTSWAPVASAAWFASLSARFRSQICVLLVLLGTFLARLCVTRRASASVPLSQCAGALRSAERAL